MDPAAVCVSLGASLAGLTWWALRGGVPKEPLDTSVYWRHVGTVCNIAHYPLKSGRGVELQESYCGPRGLDYDRCWVIIGPHGEFMNQRRFPSMVLIEPMLERHGNGDVTLHLTAPGMPELVAKQPPPNAPITTDIKVWEAAGEGWDLGEGPAEWASRYLQTPGCRMYHMAATHSGRKLADGFDYRNNLRKEDEASFADWAPLFMASEESLALLNSKLETPVPMERFRPNLTVTGCSAPHAEDSFEEVCVGAEVVLRSVRPGSRCKMTTVDPARGEFTGEEPLKTLRTYRLFHDVHQCERHKWFDMSPLFGNNFTIVQSGTIRVGDTIRSR